LSFCCAENLLFSIAIFWTNSAKQTHTPKSADRYICIDIAKFPVGGEKELAFSRRNGAWLTC
jgi:hypothetical protein